MNCKYHPHTQATHIFKAHGVKISQDDNNSVYDARARYCHAANSFLCPSCTSINLAEKNERYQKVFYTKSLDNLMHSHPDFIMLYSLDGVYYFVKSNTHIYFCAI